MSLPLETSALPDPVEEYLSANRSELLELTEISWTTGSYEPIDSAIVEASASAAEAVVDDRVFRRSATGGGDAKVFRHEGIPTVEFGFGTQTAHGTDEYTTTDALVWNVTAYALIPAEYERQSQPRQ